MKLLLVPIILSTYLLLVNGIERQHFATKHQHSEADADDIPSTWVKMEDCKRRCNGRPRTCYLKLVIQRYSILGPACGGCENGTLSDCTAPQCVTADGYIRACITANRQIPGPPIEVCQNDTVVVDAVNAMSDEATSLHWHGIKQHGSQWADGVPYVTQCPIQPGTTFRYAFVVEATGTYFYHSHVGVQKIDGLNGPLIVRGIMKNDLHSKLYDEDIHVMLIQDWTHVPGEHLMPGLHNSVTQIPITFLVNGKGAYYGGSKKLKLPIEEFVVEPKKRYRIRIIGSTCSVCAVAVQFEHHPVTVISADGDLKFNPTVVNTVVLNSAERYDVILNADQPVGVYYIRITHYGPENCRGSQYAILRYAGSKKTLSDPPPQTGGFGKVLNDVRSKCDNATSNGLCIASLKGITNAPAVTDLNNYRQIQLALGFYHPTVEELFQSGKFEAYDEPVNGTFVKGTINKNSYVGPTSPFLTQFEDIPPESLCTKPCRKDVCSCSYYIPVPKGALVDIIIIHTEPDFAHPFHLHGYNFWVLHMGSNSSKEFVSELKEKLRKNDVDLSSRVMRDTISTPIGGMSTIRFVAHNPGYWLFHCHFNFHLDSGMAGVLKVGDIDDFKNPPPKSLPRCGNFIPDIDA